MNYTVNRSYKINFTKSSGFKYIITSTKPSVTTILKPNDIVNSNNKTINVTMYLNGLDAYNNNIITVTATDLLTGCTLTITDNLTKLTPCNDLIINIDNPDNTLTYKAIVVGKEPYSYKWSFDSNFEIIGTNTSDILNLRNIIDVTPFNISVEVTDSNGCKSTKTVTYKSSCKPVINPIIGVHDCTTINNVVYNKYVVDVINKGCGILVQELIALDDTFIYGNKSLGNNKYELIIDRAFTLNIKRFYVKNNLGYRSNDFIVTLSPTKDCTKPINCVATTANNLSIEVNSVSKESNTPLNIIGSDTDYTTFKFIAVSPQTLTSNTVLNTSLGIATYSNGSIKHIFNNTGKRNEVSINWSILNKCGDTITKSLTIKTKFVEVPDVSSKQGKLIKGKTATIKIDGVDSLRIIKNPTSGIATSTNNTITYDSTNIGVYSFEVLPSNDGATGLPFTSEYEVVSSGSAIDSNFCNLGLINLFDYVTGHSTGGNWYGVGNTMFISQANQVDFTSVPIGNYKFQYIVTAGSEQDVTTVNFNKFKFDIKSLTLIPSGLNSYKITIVHEGLLIDDIRNSIYILNGIETNIELDPNSTPTSFSFTVNTTETIRNLTYSIDTICGILTKSYVKPDVQVSTNNIVGKGIAVATLSKQNIKFVSGANNIVGKGVFLSPVDLETTIDSFSFDADYLMVQYEFTDGIDLDTRTRVVTPDIGQITTIDYIGFGANYCSTGGATYATAGIYPLASGNNFILKHGCDNVGQGFEAVLVNLINFKTAYSNENEITIDCRGWWFNTLGVNKVKLSLTLWKGGTIVVPTYNNNALPTHYTFTNPTASSVLTLKSSGAVVPGPAVSNGNAPNNNEAYRIGVIKYNLLTNVGTIDNADTTTPTIN